MRIFLARIGLGALVALSVPLSAQAVPIIVSGSAFLFTENRGPNPVLLSGWKLVLGANITPSGGSTTASATHVPSGSGPDFAVSFAPSSQAPNQYAVVVPYTGQTGQWDITTTDGSGTSAPTRTHTLDHPMQLPLITGFAASGPLLTPHLTWDAVDPTVFPSFCSPPGSGGVFPVCVVGNEFYNYQVEVRLITGTPGNPAPLVFSSAAMATSLSGGFTPAPTAFDIPLNTLQPGKDYLLGIRLIDNELEAITNPFPNPTFVSPLENRSTAYFEYSTVPAPASVLLLASGLAGLAGVAWRRHRRK